jgi:hypothetical protein
MAAGWFMLTFMLSGQPQGADAMALIRAAVGGKMGVAAASRAASLADCGKLATFMLTLVL